MKKAQQYSRHQPYLPSAVSDREAAHDFVLVCMRNGIGSKHPNWELTRVDGKVSAPKRSNGDPSCIPTSGMCAEGVCKG